MPFSSVIARVPASIPHLLVLTWITWVRRCLPGALATKVLSVPFLALLFRRTPKARSILQVCGADHLLEGENPQVSLE